MHEKTAVVPLIMVDVRSRIGELPDGRLTLRTLLAYVDDTLPPDQAREIGQKVADSDHVAQELMDRIKKVTCRRGLTVPPAAGPERIDANTVAEYLDNDLPADRVAGGGRNWPSTRTSTWPKSPPATRS